MFSRDEALSILLQNRMARIWGPFPLRHANGITESGKHFQKKRIAILSTRDLRREIVTIFNKLEVDKGLELFG